MSEIQQGRYDALLRRVADLKGPGSKVNDALTELFPVLDVERVPAELLFLSGWRLGMGSSQVPAEGASISKVQLFNPVNSGHLIVLTRVDFATVAVTHVEATTIFGPLSTFVPAGILRDTRIGESIGTVGQIRIQTDASGLAATYTIRVLGNVNNTLQDDNGICVLAPGTGWTMAPETLNQFIVASFLWRERVAEPSELNF